MRSLKQMPSQVRNNIRYVLTDIDDTLTSEGILPAMAYRAIEDLHQAGIQVIPITGRPAGWCDHIARMWPVAGVVGENGAFYFYYDRFQKKMNRRFWRSEKQRKKDRKRLDFLKKHILEKVPGAAISADQPYREADLAIDFCEDVVPLKKKEIKKIVRIFEKHGAVAKISSIHVNGWYGNYDKLSMTRIFFKEVFKGELEDFQEEIVFVGDSPNDAPMFAYFNNSIGVANVNDFVDSLPAKPAWVTKARGGTGFAELAEILLTS